MTVTPKKENSLFLFIIPLYTRLFTRLRLQFSHLNKHKFRYVFGDAIRSMCGCNSEIENTEHFLLRCNFYSAQRFEFFNDIDKVDLSFIQLRTKEQANNFLYGYPRNKSNTLNQDIIKFVTNFL